MEPTRFDTLTRSLASPSRRAALGGLVGLLLAPFAIGLDGKAKRHPRHRRGKDQRGNAQYDSPGQIHLEKKKKKGNKKKKKPCLPTCGGKICGDDGCGGSCGACGSGQSCAGGTCVPDSGSCSPACTGGKACQPNGQCICPPNAPHAAPEQYCNETCRECCIDDHCGQFSGKLCSHAEGSICRCFSPGHKDCGSGVCSQCCTQEDCIINHNWSTNFLCTGVGNPAGAGLCRCNEGLAFCDGAIKTCVDINHDRFNCGSCGTVCPAAFPVCRIGRCSL